MPKSIPTALQTSLDASVTTNAMCIEIRRGDGRAYRLTDHNTDIVFDGQTYKADQPFTVGTIDSGANLAVDNTDLALFCDETFFVLNDFKKKLFDNAQITIFWLDTVTPSDGRIIGRKGWFGPISYDQNNRVDISIFGLMKMLDFEVIRVYQPACDADFGDARCKVALDQGQAYAGRNFYTVGDWVYAYDTSLMTSAGIVNGGFETDGAVLTGGAITGWTDGLTQALQVVSQAGTPTTQQTEGSFLLAGGADGGANDNGFVSTIYQDLDITSWGTAAIDAGQLTFALFWDAEAYTNTSSGVKLTVEMFDTNGDAVHLADPGYHFFEDVGVWERRSIVTPIYATTRTLRVTIQFAKVEDDSPKCGIDDIQAFYYDHTSVQPNSDLIHRLEQVSDITQPNNRQVFNNNSFETDDAVTLALDPTITGWTVDSGGWAQVTTSAHGLTETDGDYFLAHGDDGGGVQHETTMRQTIDLLTDWFLTSSSITAGNYLCTVVMDVGFGDSSSQFDLSFVWKDSGGSTISTVVAQNALQGTGTAWQQVREDMIIPSTADQLEIIMVLRSPAGNALGTTSVDNIDAFAVQLDTLVRAQTVTEQGNTSTATTFATVAGDLTIDANLVWRAYAQKFEYDTVNVVTDTKEFTINNITADDSTYALGKLVWLSGNNVGQVSVVRIWTDSSSTVKLYFPTANTIQSGDRFQLFEGCGKRFDEDCRTRFNNAINFRGFPYVPGRLLEEA